MHCIAVRKDLASLIYDYEYDSYLSEFGFLLSISAFESVVPQSV